MHFDDRLSTVLRHSANSGTLARIQFRQLVDILALAPADLSSDLVEEGYARIDSLSRQIRAPERADLIRQSVLRLTNPRLLVQLAEVDPTAASAALAKTRLDEDTWLALIPALPIHARGILRHRRDLPPRVDDLLERLGVTDRVLPPAQPIDRETASVDEMPAFAASASATPARRELVDALAMTHEAPASLASASASPPPAPAMSTGARVAEADSAAPMHNMAALPEQDFAEFNSVPPASPPGHAVPTSLREWVRLRATGQITSAPETLENLGLTDPGIGAIVKRIEEFRKQRQKPTLAADNDSPRLPLGDALPEKTGGPTTIDIATDAQGRITWADGPWASAVIGFSLLLHETDDNALTAAAEPIIAQAVRQRLPIRAGIVALSGTAAISGDWQVDAAACFDRDTGNFTGHCGRLRRPSRAAAPETVPSGLNAEADRMRQVLHELRTPANAIQVAAEIIQQQLYGPAPHEYRALAASIAGDCAHILAGFEELDRLVKLECGALALDPGKSDLAQITCQTMDRLSSWTGPRLSGFEPAPGFSEAILPLALDHDEAERLVWRLLAALAGSSTSDERLALDWTDTGATISLRFALPRLLAEREGDALFAIGDPGRGSQALSAGVFGVGFTLRLAAAEAAAAGGDLQRIANSLVLTLPLDRQGDDTMRVTAHTP